MAQEKAAPAVQADPSTGCVVLVIVAVASLVPTRPPACVVALTSEFPFALTAPNACESVIVDPG
jgi:hypothetical protein